MNDVIPFPSRGVFPDRTWALEKLDDISANVRLLIETGTAPEMLRPIATSTTKLYALFLGSPWRVEQVEATLAAPTETKP